MKKITLLALFFSVGNLISQSIESFGIDSLESGVLKPLEIGTIAPEFAAKDQSGQVVSLKELNANGPVVLVFYRGYWCGICQKSLAEFQDELATFLSAGVQVIAVAPESEKNTLKTVEKSGLEFPVISDSDGSIMKKYNVGFKSNKMYQDKIVKYFDTTLNEINNQKEASLPVPATYLINTDGKISYVFYDPDYRKRVDIKDIMNNL